MTNVAIVGATGLVGLEMREVLSRPEFKHFQIFLFASTARPESSVLDLSKSWSILGDCPYILNASSGEVAEEIRAKLKPDQILIDNSSAFRLSPDVPLVVPEINGGQLETRPNVVANPNCTAILLCLTLNPFKEFGLQRVIVSTYQAASGAGINGLQELETQMKAIGRGEPMPAAQYFPYPLATNVFSHNTPLRPVGDIGAGYNDEEWKVIEETRKILEVRHLAISATCIRVPVRRAHTEAVTIDLKTELTLEQIREKLQTAPGLKVVDDWERNHFPMPLEAEAKDEVLVGRMRKDATLGKTFHLMLSGDQIRKGAALNAVQILKKCMEYEVK